MEITLNSPKYAEAQSLQYQMYKKQKDRKKRKNFVPELFERYYRRNEGTTDYATIPEVTLTGDFEIEFDFTANTSENSKYLGTDEAAKAGLIGIDANGTFVVRHGDWVNLGVVNLVNGSVYTLKLSRTNGVISGFINNALVGTTNYSGDWFVGQLWRAYGTTSYEYYSGILANLKIYDNGTLIRDYPLDDNSDILRNRATVLGGELWNGTASFQTGTTTVVASNIPLGIDYLVSVSGLSAGENFNIYAEGGYKALQNNVPLVVRSTDAAFSGEFRCVDFAENQDGVTISIRRADGYGTVINGNASDWGLFQQQSTGEWLGQELVVNGGFDSDLSGWDVTGADATHTVNWESGSARYVSDTTSPQLLFKQDNVSVSGLLYRLGIDLTVNSGGVKTTTGFASPENLLVNGLNTLDATANGSALGLTRATSSTDVNINNVSVKEVLNVA